MIHGTRPPALFPLVVLLSLLAGPADAVQRPPNVLFIAVDDLNAWTGFMDGHPNAQTPNMDRLAKRGTVFLNAHCQAPVCGSSRASLMTGFYPHSTGIYGHIKDEDIRRAHPKTVEATYLPNYFRQHGYETLGIGKLFHRHAPDGVFEVSGGREPGFGPKPAERMNYEADYTQTDWGAFPERDQQMPDYRSAQWVAKRLGEERRVPFFLAVGFLRPHVPWHVPRNWFKRHPLKIVQTPPYLPGDLRDVPKMARTVNAVPVMPTTQWAIENDEWKEITQAYLACVTFVDHCVGNVLEALEKSGHADRTIVVLWSDHGYQLGEKNRFAKHALWNEATRVPLVIAGPGLPQSQRVARPVGLIDIYPTLADLCGLPQPGTLDGKSLRPLLENPAADWNRPAITSYGRNNVAVSGERYRYLRYEDGSEELYDLLTDPHQWRNLANTGQFADVKRRLSRFVPEQQADWAEKSFNGITDYFSKQKRRMGTRPPVSEDRPTTRKHE